MLVSEILNGSAAHLRADAWHAKVVDYATGTGRLAALPLSTIDASRRQRKSTLYLPLARVTLRDRLFFRVSFNEASIHFCQRYDEQPNERN